MAIINSLPTIYELSLYDLKKSVQLSVTYPNLTKNGKIRYSLLLQQFRKFYTEEVLNLLDSLQQLNLKDSWLKRVVLGKGHQVHSMRNLMVILFLCEKADDFLKVGLNKKESNYSTKMENLPFGEGPWPCLNPAHNLYLKDTIYSVEISKVKKTNRIVGNFKCDCGFAYKRVGPEKDLNDRYKIYQTIEYGKLWEGELRRLIAEGHSQRNIGERLNVPHPTIKNQATRLGLEFSWRGETLQEVKLKKRYRQKELNYKSYSKLKARRERWLCLQLENPLLTKNDLSIQNSGLYMWLYNNDREWLNKNSPTFNRKKVDWDKRDIDVLNDIKTIINNWTEYEHSKTIRITKTAIANRSIYKSSIMTNLWRLPKTKKHLENVCESKENYFKRRIKIAYDLIVMEGSMVTRTAILRKAKLREIPYNLQPELDKYLYDLLD